MKKLHVATSYKNSRLPVWLKWGALGCLGCLLLGFNQFAFADQAKDLLSGVTSDLNATIQGTGKQIILVVEGLACVLHFYKTRSPAVFIGYPAVMLFTNYVFNGLTTGG